jgi:4-amino-4-deoxy-L-arabinose transferase-like glycosyltransferase
LNNKKVFYFLIAIFAIKLVIAGLFPVFADEAYYYIWSIHPQLSYFDHPGMVSWIISLFHFIFPAGHAISLRIGFVLLSFLTSLIWLKILNRQNIAPQHQFYFFLLLLLNPLTGLGSVAATPDAPLVFFWSLSYLFFLQVLDQKTLLSYAGLGLALGLGFCSKYHIVLFVLSGLVYLTVGRKFSLLRWQGVLLTIIVGGLASMPVIAWNAQNDWQSFKFQIDHGFGEEEFSWAWPVSYLVAQSLILNPFLLGHLFKKPSTSDKTFSLTQLGFFFYSSFKSVVEGNWPLTSHLHVTSSSVQNLPQKTLNRAVIYWVVFYLLLGGFFLTEQSKKVRKNLINSSQLEEIYKLTETYKPLYGPSYQVASLISWKTQKLVPKLHLLSRHDFYDSLPESKPVEGTFYVLKNDYSEWPPEYSHYKKIKLQSFDNVGLELYQFNHE